MTEYVDTKQQKIQIIKDWKDLFTQIGDNQSLLSSLKDSIYYKNFGKNLDTLLSSSRCQTNAHLSWSF